MIKKFLSDLFFSVLTHIKYYKCLSGFNVIIRKSSVLGQKILIHSKVRLYNSIIHDNINIYSNTRVHDVILNGYNKIGKDCSISNSDIGRYSYIADRSNINNVELGKFCSIGPNFTAGLGTHPTKTISSSPYFYSVGALNNPFIKDNAGFVEYKRIKIGNDVWIGANVLVVEGIEIGNGAVIGAGSVVTKNIPAYAIAGGVPCKVIKYRHNDIVMQKLINLNWWDKDEDWIRINIKKFQVVISEDINI
jgi:virginiamycin A acetyltransferase